MISDRRSPGRWLRRTNALRDRRAVALTPLLALAAYWIGGGSGLIAAAAVIPAVVAGLWREDPVGPDNGPHTSFLNSSRDFLRWIEETIPVAEQCGRQVAVMSATLDGIDRVQSRYGAEMMSRVVGEAAARLHDYIRTEDVILQSGTWFYIGLNNIRAPETENLLSLSRRLQAAFDDPFVTEDARITCTLSLGIAAQLHVKDRTAPALFEAARQAGELAERSGPGSVRIYTEGLASRTAQARNAAMEIANALETGEIFAWFQPQFETATGCVSGFEALARWDHPDRGLVSPAEFLPEVERAGLSQRLVEVILKQALTALNAWDAAGFSVPSVSVNFSADDLGNPRLPDYVSWELDRFRQAPDRLVVEVLESVFADSSEEEIPRTLNALANTGCRIDLDDFGTGCTSFVNISRFKVSRIKIDRSLVAGLDADPAQRRMVAALLAFCDKLGIEALAEGVETEEEARALRLLGCDMIQGFVAAHPMPLGETLLWLEAHAEPTANRRQPEGLRTVG